jgi:hypothetical protein
MWCCTDSREKLVELEPKVRFFRSCHVFLFNKFTQSRSDKVVVGGGRGGRLAGGVAAAGAICPNSAIISGLHSWSSAVVEVRQTRSEDGCWDCSAITCDSSTDEVLERLRGVLGE